MSADVQWATWLIPPPCQHCRGLESKEGHWRAGKGHRVSAMAHMGLQQLEGFPGLPSSSHCPAFLQRSVGTTLAGGPQHKCCDVAHPQHDLQTLAPLQASAASAAFPQCLGLRANLTDRSSFHAAGLPQGPLVVP